MTNTSRSLKRLIAGLAIVALGMFAGSAFTPSPALSACNNQGCIGDCTWDPDGGTICEWSCQPTSLMNCFDSAGDDCSGRSCIMH